MPGSGCIAFSDAAQLALWGREEVAICTGGEKKPLGEAGSELQTGAGKPFQAALLSNFSLLCAAQTSHSGRTPGVNSRSCFCNPLWGTVPPKGEIQGSWAKGKLI